MFINDEPGTSRAAHPVPRCRINTGGEKVYPQEVETVIAALPGVQDVNIVGLADEQWGQAVTAVVVAEDWLQPKLAPTAGASVPAR